MESNVLFIAATKDSQLMFEAKSMLAESAKRLGFERRVSFDIRVNETKGLAEFYNSHIVEHLRDRILIFIHADVLINDYFVVERLNEGLERFSVIGLAGSYGIKDGDCQSAWAFEVDPARRILAWRPGNQLSGRVAHGTEVQCVVTDFGPSKKAVDLLDGVFLAAKCSTLLDFGVRFDPQFAFDFYDLDFSRTCRKAGLTLGTWPISITHASGGRFSTDAWWQNREVYLAKWQRKTLSLVSSLPVTTSVV